MPNQTLEIWSLQKLSKEINSEKMSEGQEDLITKRQLALLSNKEHKARFAHTNALIRYHLQQARNPPHLQEEEEEEEEKPKQKNKKEVAAPASKKREVPPPSPAKGEESKEKKSKKPEPKEPREKPEGWLCAGNVIEGTPCELPAELQIVDAGTHHNKETHNTCKKCKKAVKKSRSEKEKK